MIRLVAIDMDGTLLRPDGHISERNVRALKGLKAMGAEFLICTGRSYRRIGAPAGGRTQGACGVHERSRCV